MPHRNGTATALLADPTRLRIVALVAAHPRRPSAVARELGISRSTATRQLRLLEQAGILVRIGFAADGRGRLYLLHRARIGAVVAWLAGTEVGRAPSGWPTPEAGDRVEADSRRDSG